jgi:membrane protease YdiL (CAAX protease family)
MIGFLVLVFVCLGFILKNLANTQSFIDLARRIGFSLPTLLSTMSLLFYIFVLMLLLVMYNAVKIEKENTVMKKGLKPQFSLSIICFFLFVSLYSYLVSVMMQPMPVVFNSLLAIIVTYSLLFIVGPIVEEMLFRKILISHLVNDYHLSRKVSISLSVFFFYIGHYLNGSTGIVLIVLGLYCSLLFIATDSIMIPIVTHSVYNVIVFFVSHAKKVNECYPVKMLSFFLGIAFLTLSFVILLKSLRKAGSIPVR